MRRRSDQPNVASPTAPSGGPEQKCGPAPRNTLAIFPIILSCTLPFLSGCYTYAESSLASLSPGLQARVTLTEDGFGRVVNQAASSGVPVDMLDVSRRGLVGRVTSLGVSSVIVELRGGGGSVFAADVPTQSVQEVAVRTFSRKRTIGAVGGGVLLFALVLNGTMGGTTSPGPPPDPEQLVVPMARGIRIGSRVPFVDVIEALSRLASSR